MVKFSDRMIDKLQPQAKRFELLERDGFTLRVTPAGVKSFCYVFKMAGQNYRLHLGEYPHCSLARARELHLEALALRKSGVNPVLARKAADAEAAGRLTVKGLAKEYIDKHARPNKRASWKEDQRILDVDVLPAIGDRPAAEVRRREVVQIIEAIAKRGAPNASWQALKVMRRMWNFGIERDLVEVSPCHMVKPVAKLAAKHRALTTGEIRAVWQLLADETDKRAINTRRLLRLVLVTGQRPGECRLMCFEHIDGDWWTIPAALSKNRREHRVFLTATAQALIGKGKKGPVFCGVTEPGEPPSPIDISAPAHAVRRMLTASSGEQPRLTMPRFTPHDLRRSCATQLGALGYGNEQIGKLLNHTDRSVTAIYNRHQYDELVREMLQAWEARLQQIVTGSGNP